VNWLIDDGGRFMSVNMVKVSYKPLWRLLVDREITKSELRKKTNIAPSTFTKMANNEQVSLNVLARICKELECGFDDVVEIVE
jgi:DNA-binding Xre family transcriptional regulator